MLSEQTVCSSSEDCMPHMLFMLFDHSHSLMPTCICILLACLHPVVHIFSVTTKGAPYKIIKSQMSRHAWMLHARCLHSEPLL